MGNEPQYAYIIRKFHCEYWKPIKSMWEGFGYMKDFPSREHGNWSPEFIELMSNRMVTGCMRYGHTSTQRDSANQFGVIESLEKRLEDYKRTGNKENLVSIANCCMVEFILEQHPNAHFDANATNDIHGELIDAEDKKK